MILLRLVLSLYQSNCYLVGDADAKEGMIIDPGSDAPVILENAEKLGLDIKTIVLTHGHRDHIGAAAAVQSATGARLAMHQAEAEFLSLKAPGAEPPFTPEIILNDGDSVGAGSLSFTIIHTPGHTPGGICLYGHGVLFSGDTLFYGSIGRFDLPGGNYPQLKESLKKLTTLPGDTVVYPGHGPETTITNEKLINPYLRD